MASSGGRSPELRKDDVSNRWVIFSPTRTKTPSDFKSNSPTNSNHQLQQCPFCIGHEHECAPEIFRVPPDILEWRIRVIQNLYPALCRNLEHLSPPTFDSSYASGNRVLDGFCFHDVMIETPVHSVQLCDLSPEEVGRIFLAYKKRIEQLASHDSIKYVQVFKNHGACRCINESLSQSDTGPSHHSSYTSARLGNMKLYFETNREMLHLSSSISGSFD